MNHALGEIRPASKDQRIRGMMIGFCASNRTGVESAKILDREIKASLAAQKDKKAS